MGIPFTKIRRAHERGHANHGWLDSYHTFSFAGYYDSAHMGFRALRVINEDRVAGGQGFGSHPHRDMEILSYVVSGALRHKDSMGHESVINAGAVQKISAGSGIVHSEFNASKSEEAHFLQIWIEPHTKGLAPSYQELVLPAPDPRRPLHLFGAPEGGEGIVQFQQDVYVSRGVLAPGGSASYELRPSRGAWVQVVRGRLICGDEALGAGDAGAAERPGTLDLSAQEVTEFLLLDLR